MRAFNQWFEGVLLVTFLSALTLVAQEPSPELARPWGFSLRVGGEYSDNRDGTATNKQSNFDTIIEPQVILKYQDADRTAARFSLIPSLRSHSNPRTEAEGGAQKATELFGAAELALMHRLTPTVTLNAGDRLTYTDDPRVIESGATERRSENFVQNNGNAGIDAAMTAEMGLGGKAGVVTTRYRDSRAAKELDTDLFTGEINAYYNMGDGWKALGLLGASEYQAEKIIRSRGSAVETYNAGFEKTITPDLTGRLMGGMQVIQYDNPALDSAHLMNGNFELTYRAAVPTRFRLGVDYGYIPPSDSAYSAQKSITFSGEVEHDVLADRLTLSFQCQYVDSQYTSEGPEAQGGAEKFSRLGVHGTYHITEKWAFTGGYFFEKWDSEQRESFTRNLLDVSVNTEW
jgi:hypothetical protein